MSDHDAWQEHNHEALAHSHRHYHVTHNFNERVGGFDHLSSEHDHEHDHAPLIHAHFPHQNFDDEHRGEAHVHDHLEAVRPAARKAAATRKATKAAAEPEPGKRAAKER